MTILITDLRTREALDAKDFFERRGDRVLTLSSPDARTDEAALMAFLEPYADTLTAVIHPAPPMFQKPFEDVSEEEFQSAAMDGPLAAWCVTKVASELFLKKGGGTIIYLGSVHAEKPVGRGFLFSSGCAAVQMLSREANQDFSAGGVNTYYIQRGISSDDPDGRSDVSSVYFGLDQRYPTRKMPEKGYLNGLLAFLLTDGAKALSGGDLRADGGMTMYYGQYDHGEGGASHA